jgi:hypothetical protein
LTAIIALVDIRDEDDARSRVQSRLLRGERILWIGGPDPSVNFTGADIFLIPFGLYFLGFSTFWLTAATTDSHSGVFGLVGVPFFLIGLYYVFGRFFYKRWNKRRTVYAITSERALALAGPRKTQAISAHGQAISTKRSRDGQHETVTFGPPPTIGLFSNRNRWPNTGLDFLTFMSPLPVAFYDVADVQGLNAALVAAQSPSKDQTANA